jgi:hypothetical protein
VWVPTRNLEYTHK